MNTTASVSIDGLPGDWLGRHDVGTGDFYLYSCNLSERRIFRGSWDGAAASWDGPAPYRGLAAATARGLAWNDERATS